MQYIYSCNLLFFKMALLTKKKIKNNKNILLKDTSNIFKNTILVIFSLLTE